MAKLLSYRGSLGTEFRRLKAILFVFGWMNSIFVPVDEHLMAALPTVSVTNIPPLLQKFPVVFGDRGRAWGIALRGGIRFTGGDVFEKSDPVKELNAFRQGSNASRRAPVVPGFVRTRQFVDGRWLLKVDTSSILGLEPM